MNPPCTSARGVYSLRLRRLPVITLLSALLAAPSGAGSETRIVLATVGSATVAPGESITIRVSVSGGPPPASAMLIGPELDTIIVERIPSDVVVAIPARMRLGKTTIGAMGSSADGGLLRSELLEFDVERTDLPLRLHSQWSRPLSFHGPSSTGIPVMLSAVFADGASPEATASTRVTYTSTDPSVAAVDPRSGIIETFAPGRATVEAVYRVGQQRVRFPFAVVVEVPMIEPSRYAVAFGEQKIGTSSTAQQVTLTNRHDAPDSRDQDRRVFFTGE